MHPKLYLLPNLLDEEADLAQALPPGVADAVASLKGLIAESEKEARRYLRRFLSREAMDGVAIRLLNEHTRPEEIRELAQPILRGETWGLISDAGLPCIADPGAPLVAFLSEKQVEIAAFPGPCSLILSLQLSGLGGQKFAFHGYLPREEAPLHQELRRLEERSRSERAVQIWMEAPYRSAKMLAAAIQALSPQTSLSLAASLTSPRQRVRTARVAAWRKDPWQLDKEPTLFLMRTETV